MPKCQKMVTIPLFLSCPLLKRLCLTNVTAENLLSTEQKPNYSTDLRQPWLLPERPIKPSRWPLKSLGDVSFVYSSHLEFVSSRKCTHTVMRLVLGFISLSQSNKAQHYKRVLCGRGGHSSARQSRHNSFDLSLVSTCLCVCLLCVVSSGHFRLQTQSMTWPLQSHTGVSSVCAICWDAPWQLCSTISCPHLPVRLISAECFLWNSYHAITFCNQS